MLYAIMINQYELERAKKKLSNIFMIQRQKKPPSFILTLQLISPQPLLAYKHYQPAAILCMQNMVVTPR
jgi:hypothetical protein